MKNTNISKIILVALAAMLAFGVIAILPESANAGYGYSGSGYYGGGSNYYGSYYDGSGHGYYSGGMYVQGLAGQQSPWYPSIVVPIESQSFFIEQTWRNYGFSSRDLKPFSNSYSSQYYNSYSNSYYPVQNSGGLRGGYGY